MEKFKIEANEEFFTNVIHVLREGGVWGWPDAAVLFTKRGDKLIGNEIANREAKKIVSEEFFNKHFDVLK